MNTLAGLGLPGAGSAMMPAAAGMAGIGGTTGFLGPTNLTPVPASNLTGPIAKAFGPEIKLDGLSSISMINIDFSSKAKAKLTLRLILEKYIKMACDDSSHPETRALRNGLSTLALKLQNPAAGSLAVPWGIEMGVLLFDAIENQTTVDALRREHALEANIVKRIGHWGWGSYHGDGLFTTACGKGEWRGHFHAELGDNYPTFIPGEYVFRGEFVGDRPKGHGRLDYPNGTTASGEFEGKCFAGAGDIHFDELPGVVSNKIQLDGRWVNLTKGDVYSGEWWNCMPRGKGILTFANGRKVAGIWETWKGDEIEKSKY